MFKKKKTTTPASPVKKAGIVKKAERRFFSLFNDKSRLRRTILTSMMLTVPAMMLTDHEDPSAQRGSQGAEHVQQYRSEISQITREGNTIRISGDGTVAASDAQRAQALEARAEALAARLAGDAQISEQDAQQLTRMFLRDINNPVFGKELRQMLDSLADNSAFLNEARERLSTGQNASPGAERIIDKASAMNSSDFTYSYMYHYFLMMMLLETAVMGLLRRGSKRDDKLKKEELIEDFSERAAQIRAMLTPKGQTPPTPAQAPVKPKQGKTGSTGPH